ncbi:MAG: mannitol dehydrogenase family protein, partial [Clostridia bacterium]|nr:mannitol dehydrogenase family protein [Clostridia bacterium]
IAPFVNAEKPQYLVIEDCFPNGRPPLQQINSVYLTDRETVEKAERMKVTACLNPVHSATGPFGVLLGIDLFADVISDPDLSRMAKAVAYDEGLPVAPDPGIISPRAFTDELFKNRFPNRYLGDTNLRLCTDVSQGVGVRFGETIKEYTRRYGSADRLTAIPLGIAGWLRYMLAVDDRGEGYELAPDPMNEAITALLADVRFDDPKTLSGQLRPLLSDSSLFHVDLYSAGVGEKIETMFSMMLSGKGGVRRTVHRFFG